MKDHSVMGGLFSSFLLINSGTHKTELKLQACITATLQVLVVFLINLRCLSAIFGFYYALNAGAWGWQDSARFSTRINQLVLNEDPGVSGALLINPDRVAEVYTEIGPQMLWIKNPFELNVAGSKVIDILHQANTMGLLGQDYDHELIEKHWDATRATEAHAIDLELLLTDRLLLLSQHVKNGKVNAISLEANWQIDEGLASHFIDWLESVRNQELDPNNWLKPLEPRQRAYQLLKAELSRVQSDVRYVSSPVSLNKTLKIQDRDDEVATVRRLLNQFNYLDQDSGETLFDADMQKALMKFQVDHSLAADGIAGPDTRLSLRQLVHGDPESIRVNMERWRWMPESFGESYITVNIANFNLNYYFNSRLAFNMKTIVGKNYRKTPIFSGDMRYFVINPSWSVPHAIASKDLLPKIQKDSNYLRDMNMQVYRGWGEAQRLIDPETIDWSALNSKNFPYHLRQLPGEKNALGKVKFMFPNEHDVYLHDTNDNSLFAKSQRAFSSGCIRLEKPIELLMLIAQNHAGLSEAQVRVMLDSKQEKTVLMQTRLPVHIQYWTTWIDEDNRIHYRSDIYQRDAAIIEALSAKPPSGLPL